MKKEFEYKGVKINRYDFESAPCPMNCDKISDEKMQEIAKKLHHILYSCYGFSKEEIDNYLNGTMTEESDNELWNDIDDLYYGEEENLFYEYGGEYYE